MIDTECRRRENVLCVVEDGAALVQQEVDAELDAAFDDPAEGTVVVVCGVVYEEGVVESQGLRVRWGLRWRY